ncbi:MAG: hypothetical protein MZV65_42205 [Chromatiales bacterium]|nr:hypothetical protein [Chromatiales bacterium]
MPKVGPKTAAKWLSQYGDARRPAGARRRDRGQGGREPARQHSTELALSRQLATIDVRPRPRRCSPTDLGRRRARRASGCASCTRGSSCARCCRQLPGVATRSAAGADPRCGAPRRRPSRRRGGAGPGPTRPPATTRPSSPRRSSTPGSSACASAELFAFDTETTSRSTTCRPRSSGVSLLRRAGPRGLRAARAPLRRGARAARPRPPCSTRLKPLLEDPASRKLGHHLKYDAHVLRNHGIELRRHALRLDARVLRARTAPPRATTWTRWRGTTSASRPSTTRTWPARARSRSPFDQVPVEQRRRVLGRGRRRHAAAAPRAVAAARAPAAGSRSSTRRSSSRWCRCCSTWSTSAC